MINIVLGIIATVLVLAFALNVARWLITAWTWVFTSVMPKEERDSHRAEVHSDVHDHIANYREEGHSPSGIAALLIVRFAWGLKDHLAHALPYAPEALADHLVRGSNALSRGKSNSMVISTLAVLLVFNFAFWTSREEHSLVEWGFLSLSVPVIGKLYSMPLAPWVKKALEVSACVTLLAGMGAIAWYVVQNRIYDAPFFAEFVATMGILALALWGAVTVSKRLLRGRTIRERGWAVAALWGITILGSLLAANWISGTAEYLAALWLMVSLTVIAFAATLLVALICAVLLWRGGTWAASKGMRAMADTFRR